MSPRTLRPRLAVFLASAGAATFLTSPEVRADSTPQEIPEPAASVCLWQEGWDLQVMEPSREKLCRNMCRWGQVDAIARKNPFGGIDEVIPCDRLKPEEKEI